MKTQKNKSLNLKLQTSNFKLSSFPLWGLGGLLLLAVVILAGCKKNDKPDTTIKVTDITINGQANVTVVVGNTLPLSVTITPADATNKTVSWITDDATVATVDAQGVVKGVKAGTTKIKAITVDGFKEATWTVTVVSTVAVTGITGIPTTATVGTLTLNGTVNPDNATNKTIVWSVANAGTTGASISGNTLTTTAAGTVTVRATITNGLTTTTDYTQDFTITVKMFTGEGTSDSPYLITNAADLARMSELINDGTAPYADAGKYYRLNADINLSGYSSGAGWMPIGTYSSSNNKPFKGNFDGNNKTISNLTINNASTDYIGLFGFVSGGTIQNLGLVNVNIKGGYRTGGVAGYITGNGAYITRCFVTGSVSGTQWVGGIAGTNSGTVIDCYTTCSVSSSLTCVSGIVGYNGGTVNRCYAIGAISGTSGVSGIVGWHNQGTISNCVALNPSITRTEGTGINFGRVIGGFDIGNTFTNNAALGTMTTNSGVSITTGDKNGAAITAAQAKTQTTYISRGWAFGTTDVMPWKWPTSGTYLLPIFYWQTAAPIALPTHLN